MSGTPLLAGGIVALALAFVIIAMGLIPERAGRPSVDRALTTIDERYTHRAGGARRDGDAFQLPDWMRRLAQRLSPAGVASVLQRRLDIAGNPRGWTSDRVLAVKGLGLVALGFLGALYGLRDPKLLILGAGLGAVMGFFLPDLLLYNSGLRRQQQIPAALPDALDMLTICVEAGLGFDAALAQVARNTKGPVAAEFSRVLQEMQIGKSRGQALRAMADRTTVPELQAFVAALVQSGDMGIPVAHVLREQAKEMRVRRRQRAEEQAQKVPVKITFPLIFCLFPAMMVVILGPGVIEIAHTFLGK
jgi:tight adherence protein C